MPNKLTIEILKLVTACIVLLSMIISMRGCDSQNGSWHLKADEIYIRKLEIKDY